MNIFLCYFKIIRGQMFACMDALLKNVYTASLIIMYTPYHIPGRKQTPHLS